MTSIMPPYRRRLAEAERRRRRAALVRDIVAWLVLVAGSILVGWLAGHARMMEDAAEVRAVASFLSDGATHGR